MRSFLNLVDYICAKISFGRQVAFLGETAESCFKIIQNVNVKIRAKFFVFVFNSRIHQSDEITAGSTEFSFFC